MIFYSTLCDCGDTLPEALLSTIRAYGVTEFSKVCGMAEPNILQSLREGSNPIQRTLETLLKPFGLKLGVTVPEKAS